VAHGCKKVNSSKDGRYRYEMVGETQSEIELLDVVAFFYTFSLKEGSSIPSATRIQFLNTASLIFLYSSKYFFKKPWSQVHRKRSKNGDSWVQGRPQKQEGNCLSS